MRGRGRVTAVLLLVVVVAASTLGRWGATRPIAAGERPLVEGINQLGIDLLSALSRQAPDENQLLSPLSISAAWALMYAGSRGGTAETLARTLHYAEPPASLGGSLAAVLQRLETTEFSGCSWRPRAELGIARGVFGTPGVFTREYRERVRADALECDESLGSPSDAVARINAWAAHATRGRIPAVLSPADVPDYQAAVMLVSAVYFKCSWLQEFPKTLSQDNAEFSLESGQRTHVTMMRSRTGSRFRHLQEPGVQILEMPYLSAHPYSMLVLLPTRDSSLAALRRDLTPKKIERWLGQLKEEEVVVGFPRFTFRQAYDLGEPLDALGMGLVFTPQADFSGMTAQPLKALRSQHATWINVNERGTEAAAVTVNGDFVIGGGSSLPIFWADHPFLFLIRDEQTGAFLFVGQMMNPAAQGASEPRRI